MHGTLALWVQKSNSSFGTKSDSGVQNCLEPSIWQICFQFLLPQEQSYAEKGVGSSSGQANVDQATVNKTKEWEDAMKQWVNR
jgi:hypothetical protein